MTGKTGKEIRVLRKAFSKQITFIKCRRQRLFGVEYTRCRKFTFAENTIIIFPRSPESQVSGK